MTNSNGGNPGPPPPFDPQTTRFNAANPLRLSMQANAAYLYENEARTIASALGLSHFVWLDLTDRIDDLHGFAAGCPDYAVSIERFKEFFDIAIHFGVDVGDHAYGQYESRIATNQGQLEALFA